MSDEESPSARKRIGLRGEVEFAIIFTDCTKDPSAAALIHRQQTFYWLFAQTKLSCIYRNKPILSLMHTCIGS